MFDDVGYIIDPELRGGYQRANGLARVDGLYMPFAS